MLIGAVTRAPLDYSEASKQIWSTYYNNFQLENSLEHIRVADIFMGGGTTIVEGSRLGMQMFGNDLNPVAWFIVKNEMAQADKSEVEDLLADIEKEVKPQIMPFYACDCPRGHRGKWTRISTGEIMGDDFDPLGLTPEQRKDYSYKGPEIIYVFWAKHGPCQVTGCGHRTPVMTSPEIAVKTLTVKSWNRRCKHCGKRYDLEERDARMAPGVPLVVAETENPFAVAQLNEWGKAESAVCPCCGQKENFGKLPKGKNKKIELSLLVHPDWLKGEAGKDPHGRPYGGSADDPVEDTIRWNEERAAKCRLIEVRGKLPSQLTLPVTQQILKTGNDGGTSPKSGIFTCAECGTSQKIVESIQKTGKTASTTSYAIQGFCPECQAHKQPYGGRFFMPADNPQSINAAVREWSHRKANDLQGFWPKSEIPFGHMTHQRQPLPQHGYTHWWKMFNGRQLLVHSQLLSCISLSKKTRASKELVIGAFLQYLRLNNLFSIWHKRNNQISAFLSNANFQPKSTTLESGVFCEKGDGSWSSALRGLTQSIEWKSDPWELVVCDRLCQIRPDLKPLVSGKSEKIRLNDPTINSYSLACESSTEIGYIDDGMCDLVITDPPFGGLMHYSELADFFYVWLRILLKAEYPDSFLPEYTPKTLEAVANKARQPGKDDNGIDNADIFYQRLLTACWGEAFRILKPGGILAFTFHHKEDDPWVSVLESLFDAGFYLQATYPIRSDETKGEGEFGSRKIEYDMIHVCRKRHEEPKPISWAKLRRQVLQDIRALQELLEHHQREGLPEADLQVIRRGKALEYFSRHYGKVYKDQDTSMTVLEALIGINQLLDEEAGGVKEPPPHNAEPFTRMLLRVFDGISELPRDQMQKFLRGTGSAPSDYINRGWVYEDKKVFYLTSPVDLAKSWVGKQRKGMTSDYDQAMFFLGACFEGSGINASDTLNNPSFRPHPALGAILTWFRTHGASSSIRNAAIVASQLYRNWESKNQPKVKQLSFFDVLGEKEA